MEAAKEALYNIMNVVTLGKGIKRKINNYEITFPTRYFRYFPSNYELENFAFLQQHVKPGNVVVDVGAHIGLFSVVFAKIVGKEGKVFSFEPTPSTSAILHKTIELNRLTSIIEIRHEELSKEKGEAVFFISNYKTDNGNSLVDYRRDREQNGIKVPLISADEFAETVVKKKINFIKIDAEGAEQDIKAGARNVFLTHRPAGILSLHPPAITKKGDSLEDIWNLIRR